VRLLYHTIKYLKIKQIVFRLFYLIRNRFFKIKISETIQGKITPMNWRNIIYNQSSLENKTFTFLNVSKKFNNGIIDWNYNEFGKLWTYNLTYFDFLNQKNISIEAGKELIEDFIKNKENLKDALEPYPISLRGINWVKFLAGNQIEEVSINESLFEQFQILSKNLEYHLLGNHLLENGYSLFFGAIYFRNEKLLKKASKILKRELNEQVLNDGAHFELSPMYHQILLYRLLDCINLINLNKWESALYFKSFFEEKAELMLSWLQMITFSNGDIPMVNDSTYGIAPSSEEIFNYADKLNLKYSNLELKNSGYRMFKNNEFELFVDVGNVGANYQPAHVHSDTFNFLFNKKSKPIFVDVGVSTYEKNQLRNKQRSTESHNTVKLNKINQTGVWGGFRVANRAEIIKIDESENHVSATHNGYENIGVLHTRGFKMYENKINITDSFVKKGNKEISKIAYFHLHPSLKSKLEIINRKLILKEEGIDVCFEGDIISVKEEIYQFSKGFNQLEESKKIVVEFKGGLETNIYI